MSKVNYILIKHGLRKQTNSYIVRPFTLSLPYQKTNRYAVAEITNISYPELT